MEENANTYVVKVVGGYPEEITVEVSSTGDMDKTNLAQVCYEALARLYMENLEKAIQEHKEMEEEKKQEKEKPCIEYIVEAKRFTGHTVFKRIKTVKPLEQIYEVE